MCRNIKTLFNFAPPATEAEIEAAALQYVRKVVGSTRPAKANEEAFVQAVAEITEITRRLVREHLVALGPPRSREVLAQQAKARGQQRDARTRARLQAELGLET